MSKLSDRGSQVIVALDLPNGEQALDLVSTLGPKLDWVKVGLELFVAEGPDLVRKLVDRKLRVMLDLKLHDIPATVARATARARELGVELLTVHSVGGQQMLEAAQQEAGESLQLLAVTVLTSMDASQLSQLGFIIVDAEKAVVERAEIVEVSGVRGVVASPKEASALRERFGSELLIVTPGVRPVGSAHGDQARVTTPAQAIEGGADLIVVGRPIRDAAFPAQAYEEIRSEVERVTTQGN